MSGRQNRQNSRDNKKYINPRTRQWQFITSQLQELGNKFNVDIDDNLKSFRAHQYPTLLPNFTPDGFENLEPEQQDEVRRVLIMLSEIKPDTDIKTLKGGRRCKSHRRKSQRRKTRRRA